MKNYRELFKKMENELTIREFEDFVIVTPAFYFLGTSESIAIRISEDELGRPIFSDCHTTFDYLDEIGIDLNNFQDKLNVIKEKYDLSMEENSFTLKVPTNQDIYIIKYLGFFIQAISLIANIDIYS